MPRQEAGSVLLALFDYDVYQPSGWTDLSNCSARSNKMKYKIQFIHALDKT